MSGISPSSINAPSNNHSQKLLFGDQQDETHLFKFIRRRMEGIVLIAMERAGYIDIDRGFCNVPESSGSGIAVSGDIMLHPELQKLQPLLNQELTKAAKYLQAPVYGYDSPQEALEAAGCITGIAVQNARTYMEDPKQWRTAIAQAIGEAKQCGLARTHKSSGYSM